MDRPDIEAITERQHQHARYGPDRMVQLLYEDIPALLAYISELEHAARLRDVDNETSNAVRKHGFSSTANGLA